MTTPATAIPSAAVAAPPLPEPRSLLSSLLRGEVPQGNPIGLLVIAFELAIFTWLAFRINLESSAFRTVLKITCAAFLVNHFLPARAKLPFFSLISLVGTVWVLGMDQGAFKPLLGATRTGVLFAIGAVLVGMCHLPISFRARIAVVTAATGGLMLFAGGFLDAGSLNALIPILGALFMLRIIVYLYDVSHGEPFNFFRAVSYFFVLPNVAFPLFPVIDYKTFVRTHYDVPAFVIYQQGINWLMRGMVHVALGRIIYYQIYLDPSRVTDGSDFARYFIGNYGLYLKVSGSFHIIIGLLKLFGFNLPETNHHYYLANSFTDLWRRVNIYWKDFMTKVFYYPSVFAFKAMGPLRSMIAATAVAFFFTYWLHAYQTYWMRGTIVVRLQDVIFWTLLGALVARDAVKEATHGRARTLTPRKPTVKEVTVDLARTVGTYVLLTSLWSLWSADSIPQWLGLWKHLDGMFMLWLSMAVLAIVIAKLVLEIQPWKTPAPAPSKLGKLAAAKGPKVEPPFSIRPVLWQCLLPALLIWGVTSGRFNAQLNAGWQDFARSVMRTGPNKSDEELMVRNYYEDIMDTSRSNVALQDGRPPGWQLLENTAAIRPLKDIRSKELIENGKVVVNGKKILVNSMGMRDREYALQKPPDTVRVALLGSSLAMGWGVENSETFESLVEDRLNRELSPKTGKHYEILSFAVNGYDQVSQVLVLNEKVVRWKPDMMLLLAHFEDIYFVKHNFAKALRKSYRLPSNELLSIAKEAGIDSKTPELQAERALGEHWTKLIAYAYGAIAKTCKENGMRPLWLWMPGVISPPGLQPDDLKLVDLAKRAGFVASVLPNPFGTGDKSQLVVGSWDAHPNAAAHKLIANAVYEQLVTTL